MFPGVTRARNSTYSSEWNWVISLFVAGLARWFRMSDMVLKQAGCGCARIFPFSCINRNSSPANGTYVSELASSCRNQFIARSKLEEMRARTGDQDHNGIQRCLSRRSNTIEIFSGQPVPMRGTVDTPRASWPNRRIQPQRYPGTSLWDHYQTRYPGSDWSRPKSVGLLTERASGGRSKF